MLSEPGFMPSEKSGEGAEPAVVVQLPSFDQPLSCIAFCTSMKIPLAPANAAWKLIARFNVSVFPEADTEDAPAFTEHWLLESVPALPTVSGPCQPSAAFDRYREFEARE